MSVITITPYERRHRHAVFDLLYRSYFTHTHLDWFTTEYWLDSGSVPLRLAWQENEMIGMLGASVPLNSTAWLRLIAVRDGSDARVVIGALWRSLRKHLWMLDVKEVVLLITGNWLLDLVPSLGFNYADSIITLRRTAEYLPRESVSRLSVELAEFENLAEITRVDQTAFAPPWQLSQGDLRQAMRIAALVTIARSEGEIIGYQLSTRHRSSGHLARLAVNPAAQRQGVGRALLAHLIPAFAQRGVQVMTVNTQASNHASQQLYRQYGFERNGQDMPVWSLRLADVIDRD